MFNIYVWKEFFILLYEKILSKDSLTVRGILIYTVRFKCCRNKSDDR